MRAWTAARRLLVVGLCLATAGALTGCGSTSTPAADRTKAAASTGASTPPAPAVTSALEDVAMKAPGRLTQPLLSPDVLVFSSKTLSSAVVQKIGRLKGVVATQQFAEAQFYNQENQVTYAAVDPATFRRWTIAGTAQTTAVWDRVADGEIAMQPALSKKIQNAAGYVQLGDATSAPVVHIGAYAQLLDPTNALGLDAVVNQRWVSRLHMKPDNALLVSTGVTSPQSIQAKLRAITGTTASVQILGPNFDVHSVQTAVLTGESVSTGVGAFNYTANSNGSITIHGRWAADHIETVKVPIVGAVTCNRMMIPQLVDALDEVEQRGLAKYIVPSQYGGCFVPRYIAGTHTLSYHAFGLAIDLNVPGNERGTVGQINRQVVAIFLKWGFEWGGNWHYTDPMHFQLSRLVTSG